MLTQQQIIDAAQANGFGDVGFTTAEPFESQYQYLAEHQEEYGWTENERGQGHGQFPGSGLYRRSHSKKPLTKIRMIVSGQ